MLVNDAMHRFRIKADFLLLVCSWGLKFYPSVLHTGKYSSVLFFILQHLVVVSAIVFDSLVIRTTKVHGHLVFPCSQSVAAGAYFALRLISVFDFVRSSFNM
jgi:hypothetical protein